MRTRDPETGYIGQTWTGKDYGENVRCARCDGRGMVQIPLYSEEFKIVCLRCADDWDNMTQELFAKHGFKDARNRKAWWAAFNEFLRTKPKEIDIKVHNARIKTTDDLFFRAFPQQKELCDR